MAKVTKATARFKQKHLKNPLEKRKLSQKHSQKIQLQKRNKKQRRKDEDGDNKKPSASETDPVDIESYMNEEFQIPKMTGPSNVEKAKRGTDNSSDSESSEDETTQDYQQTLSKLKETDPEFFDYLQENDDELLDFANEDPNSDVEQEESEDETADGDDQTESKSGQRPQHHADKIQLTVDLVKSWKKQLSDTKSLDVVRQIIAAFEDCVLSGDAKPHASEYHVTDPEAFSVLLVLALTKVLAVLEQVAATGDVEDIFEGQVNCLSVLLETGKHDSRTLSLILNCTSRLVPLLLSEETTLKKLITAVARAWGSPHAADESIVATFGLMREAATEHKSLLLETTIKAIYATMLRCFRKTRSRTMPRINLRKNLASALFQVDPNISYQLGFQYIRQLAIHLRNSITQKSAESYKVVYNWQYAHALDFWSRCLCSTTTADSKNSPMHSLIYPLVQVTLGAARLVPSQQFFPLRFYLVQSLLRISSQTGVYIPLLPVIIEVLTSTALTKNPKPSSLRPLNFDCSIRASKSYWGTRVYQDGLSERLVDLLGEFYVLHCKSIAFPELVIPAVVFLKRYIKKSKNAKLNKGLSRLVARLMMNAQYIEQHRAKVTFGPRDLAQVSAFLKDEDWTSTPLGAYVLVARQVKEEKDKLLNEDASQSDQDNEDDRIQAEDST